jgi:hypothetical protein
MRVTAFVASTASAQKSEHLLGDDAALARFSTPFWTGLCFLPLLILLLMFARMPVLFEWGTTPGQWVSTFRFALHVAEQNLPLAFLLALALAVYLAVDSSRRPTQGGRERTRRLAAQPSAGLAWALTGTAVVTGTYASLVANRGFPVTEGWFEVFARYVNDGRVPYRDFELLSPPLYTYILAGITRVFGYDLIVLRIVGILVFVAIAVLACLIFARLFAPFIAMIAACVTAFYLQSEVANIFYDYIRFFDLFAYAACLCLIVSVQSTGPRRRWSPAIMACGLCSGSALLIRQNSGVVLAAAIIAVLAILAVFAGPKGQRLIDLAAFTLSCLTPIAILALVMVANGSLGPFLTMSGSEALAAKGGLSVVLFGWTDWVWPAMSSKQSSILLLGGLLLINGGLYAVRDHGDPRQGEREGLLWGALFFGFALAGVALCFTVAAMSVAFARFRALEGPLAVYPVVCALCVYAVLMLVAHRSQEPAQRRHVLAYAVLTFVAVALGYGALTSSALSEGQTALGIGIVVATILFLTRHVLRRPAQLVVVTLCIALCLGYASFKIERPYDWWYLQEPSLHTATERLDIPLLRGIRVSPSTKTAVEGIADAIVAHSRPGDDVFTFPHIPIFYLLTDRFPRTFTLEQWFDFSSAGALDADRRRLQLKPPTVIVLTDLPSSVYDAHQGLYLAGKTSPQRRMYDGLERLIRDDQYEKVGTWTLDEGYRFTVYARR